MRDSASLCPYFLGKGVAFSLHPSLFPKSAFPLLPFSCQASVEVQSLDRYGRQSCTLSSPFLLCGTASCFAYLRAAKCLFPGTDCCFGVLRAARCLFPGTAAGRLSRPAATARRCGGLCAMALLAAAVASRRYGPRHSDSSFLSQTALTSNRLLSAFQLSTRHEFVAKVRFPCPR